MLAVVECFLAQCGEMGVKAALECIHPAAGKGVELFQGVWKKWQEKRQRDQMRKEMEELAKKTAEQLAAEVREKLHIIAPDDADARQALEQYVTLIPAAVRASCKRADDPSGRSLPVTLVLAGPQDLVRLFPVAVPLFRPGTTLPGLSSWVLGHLLGAGGFGEVWLATHAVDGSRRAAVKFCTEPADKLKLLEHELKQVVRLMRAGGHPGVVGLLEYNLDAVRPWLMYEYVGGGTLADQILEWQAVVATERRHLVLTAFAQLVSAVAHLHRLDPPLVHRDLKPANVLRCDRSGCLRVTDLGLGGSAVEYVLAVGSQGGRAHSGRLPSVLFGSHSLHYASPEQRRGGPPDPRDDVHALGVIAYQMFTGKLDAAPGFDLTDDLREAGASEELIALVGRCVSQRADRRPKDAGEVLTGLAPVSREATPSAPPPPPATTPALGVASRLTEVALPLRGRLWSQPAVSAKPAWKVVTDTPATVAFDAESVFRLELPARITDAELAALQSVAAHPHASQLVRLDLSGCEKLTDAGLRSVAALPGVLHLNLYGCRELTAAGIAHLAGMSTVTRLDLTRCTRLTDTALAPLGKLPRLEHLSLAGCEWVTDAGLAALAGVRTLKVLSVRGTQVSPAAAERFPLAVPGCVMEV
jgi:hypothetical protein